MHIETKLVEPFKVAYIRHFGAYGLEPTKKTLKRLLMWARSRQLTENARVLGIPWNNPKVTPDEECCYDACLVVPSHFESDHPSVETQTVPGGTYLVRTCDAVAGDLEKPWQEFLAWYHESAWEIADGPCFEVYANGSYQDPDGNWSMELFMPVVGGSESADTARNSI